MNIIINELTISIAKTQTAYKWLRDENGEPYRHAYTKRLRPYLLNVDSKITAEGEFRINDIYTDGDLLYVCIESNGLIGVLVTTQNLIPKYEIPTELIRIASAHAEM